jgi:Zn-dependent M28 family amino/carboxypeptidase
MSLLLATFVTAFSAGAIKAHIQFLANDLLEGRGTGTRGYRIAANYVAAQFGAIGLETSFQEVPLRETVPSAQSSVTLLRDGAEPVTLRAFEQFVTQGNALKDDETVEAPVVFAGFGVTAPDQTYDDYANLDVRGKIVAIFGGAPPSFSNAIRAHHSASLNKIENAARHGAVGLITLESPKDAQRSPWTRVTRQSKLGTMHWLRADGTPNAVNPQLTTGIGVDLDTTKTIFGGEAEAVFASLDRGQPQPKPLKLRARIHLVSAHRQLTSPNVIGILRGSDPKLRDEYVVYSAHLDHLGITEPVNGDSINNGALDNGTGVAAIIEIAKAFAALPERPRRSILFLATTGEEKGLKGADYFANNPTVPFESIAADVNIDMLLLLHKTSDVVVFGIDNSDLGDMARAAARDMSLEISTDRAPEEVVFVRSDQYPFIKRGIPAIFVNSGYKAVEAGVDMAEEMRVWRRTRYHMPSDDLQQPIDYEAALLPVELDFRIGLAAANREERPKWKAGDFFGETFGRR